ncbi:hypothetical protein TRAPUB_12734 [Trametes pubescens]|uniref:Uncharacterized protein n=1 Tax=Trametes pubescens TaxID=154538 RepID=A0A1M2VT08_TRAPU|nr:hypothetical protein TRAPUB_12734 [Trametes pubescens]
MSHGSGVLHREPSVEPGQLPYSFTACSLAICSEHLIGVVFAWQKVLATLGHSLSTTRAKCLDKELRAALVARFHALEDAITAHYVNLPRTARMEFRPRYIDFALMPKCRAIAEVPASATVTAAQFTAVVPALAKRWDEERRMELTEYLRPHLGDVAPDVDPLELAIAFFRNRKPCCAPIWRMRYPAIFMHDCSYVDCFRTDRGRTTQESGQDDLYTRTTKSLDWIEFELNTREYEHRYSGPHVPFNIRSLAGPIQAHEVVDMMRRVVAALGLDPAWATFDDLERCEVWLRCTTCETQQPLDEVRAMSWTAAHWLTVNKQTPEWRHADHKDMAKVRALRETQFDKANCSAVLLALCLSFDAYAESMTAHLEDA